MFCNLFNSVYVHTCAGHHNATVIWHWLQSILYLKQFCRMSTFFVLLDIVIINSVLSIGCRSECTIQNRLNYAVLT